ncbi:MAG TPA: SMC-Scp complex subunit ScpB [Wenzhouxiangellaceae bacterium]|nr:SMC-Scp complex subunit ScpB [Wenzhouxiangellaceae bacterium]
MTRPVNSMEAEKLKIWLEGALLAAGQPLTLTQLNGLFDEDEQPGHGAIREALALLDAEMSGRAVELVEVAGGYRLQIRRKLMPVVSRLWAEKPPRYSRALLETLAIIAYRQPITRSEIEQIRGVSLSANILKTLQEREWIKVVGHRDIPGKPELLGTTKSFLDYFGLKGLDDLPTLAEIRDLDNIEPELALNDPEHSQAANDDQQAQANQQDSQEHDADGQTDRDEPENHKSDAKPEETNRQPDEHEPHDTVDEQPDRRVEDTVENDPEENQDRAEARPVDESERSGRQQRSEDPGQSDQAEQDRPPASGRTG